MKTNHQENNEPKRRLSLIRVILALLIIGIIGQQSMKEWEQIQETRAVTTLSPWFAGYVDVTATPRYAFEQLGATTTPNVVLAFIVSSTTDACEPSWGTYYSLDEAAVELDLDRRIARLRQQGGEIAVSFGGLLNDELAVKCQDEDKLMQAYEKVIDRYNIDTIDLDLEGTGLTDMEAAKRRTTAIAALQFKRREAGKSLAVWLTLPVAPQGLTQDGTNGVAQFLTGGVDLAGVNVMTMDYGGSRNKQDSMQQASQKALIETHRQLGILYQQAGISLSEITLWSKIGATPMIGQNDIIDEIFTLDDAKGFNEFAVAQGITRMSMWSANRDIQCGENYVDVKVVSDSCSGIKQDNMAFASLLSKDFDGSLQQNATVVTTHDPNAKAEQKPDDPENSPYQIWKETGTYLQGTKVVWHGNVYEAKWWTQGDIPDNPVLQAWETPWQIIGPVLPGEKPVTQPTLPPGTYPNWIGTAIYEAGQRVLFDGVPYQAKWWTQGDSPAAASANADSSPWVPLNQQTIEELVKNLKSATPTPFIRRLPSLSPSPSLAPSQ